MRAARHVETNRDEAARIGAKYIGLNPEIIRKVLNANRLNPDAIRNQAAMDQVIGLMVERGYIDKAPSGYKDLKFLDKAEASLKQAATAACC
jgi:ABC-type nitrate/sulfonate/bicarbonate transport system substrate-binding protein